MNPKNNSRKNKLLIVILGPTAVGKTSLAVRVAAHYMTEVLSADSRQFYREMSIGTALPEKDELKGVPHHFLANRSIHDDFNVYQYEKDAITLLDSIFDRQKILVMVGGSGLYIDAVCKGIDELPDADDKIRQQLKQVHEKEGLEALCRMLRDLDPEYHAVVDQNNPNRIMRALEVCMITGEKFSSLRKNKARERQFRVIKIGLDLPREELFERIHNRVDAMMDKGLLEEVRRLYPYRAFNALKTVGYKELFDHLDGKAELERAIEQIKTNTRRYAKRQLTWFKRDHSIQWFRPDEVEKIIEYVDGILDAGY